MGARRIAIFREERLQFSGNGRESRLTHVPPPVVERHSERGRLVAAVFHDDRLDLSPPARLKAISAVEDHAVERPDGLELALLTDVVGQFVEIVIVQHGPDVCDWMCLHRP